jgi:glycosyltransferase involved in cell wall biosynthesis
MRILHIATAKTWRGGEQQLAYLMEELQKQDTHQHLLCVQNSRVANKALQLGIPCSFGKKRTSLSLSFALKVRQTCQKQSIDIIHTHDAHAHTFAVWAAQLFGNYVPIIVSRRVDFPIKKSFLSQLKYNHDRVKKIVCVSDAVKNIAAEGLVNHSTLTVIHDGIDLHKFDMNPSNVLRGEFGIDDGCRLIGNVSALAPHKDYFTFIDTVYEFVSNKYSTRVKFLIIGEGSLEQALKAYAVEKEVQQDIIFTGFRNDVAQVLKELDLFLMTSKTEGLGTSIIDAMACEVPVVATKAGGIPELVIHQKTGLLASVGDSKTLATHCHTLLTDGDFRENIIATAKDHASSFSKSEMALKTLACYRSVLLQ